MPEHRRQAAAQVVAMRISGKPDRDRDGGPGSGEQKERAESRREQSRGGEGLRVAPVRLTQAYAHPHSNAARKPPSSARNTKHASKFGCAGPGGGTQHSCRQNDSVPMRTRLPSTRASIGSPANASDRASSRQASRLALPSRVIFASDSRGMKRA